MSDMSPIKNYAQNEILAPTSQCQINGVWVPNKRESKIDKRGMQIASRGPKYSWMMHVSIYKNEYLSNFEFKK